MRSRRESAEERGTVAHRQVELTSGSPCEVPAGSRDLFQGLAQGHIGRQNEEANPSLASHQTISKTFDGVCVFMCVCTLVLMYGSTHAFGGPGLRSSVFLYWSPPDLLREGLSPNLELTIQTLSDTG